MIEIKEVNKQLFGNLLIGKIYFQSSDGHPKKTFYNPKRWSSIQTETNTEWPCLLFSLFHHIIANILRMEK